MIEEKPEFQYDYISAFCKACHYTCLMPVEYRLRDNEYHKSKMVCRMAKTGECNEGEQCEHFQTAPETPDKKAHLQTRPYQ